MHLQQGTFAVDDVDGAIIGCWQLGAFVRKDTDKQITVVAPVDVFNQCRELLTGKPAPVAIAENELIPDDGAPLSGNAE